MSQNPLNDAHSVTTVLTLLTLIVTRKLREALGVNEQLANLQGELEALRKDVRVRDEAMVSQTDRSD